MPFCPSCKTEYVESVAICSDCGEVLVDALVISAADPCVRLVDVYIAHGEVDAQLVRSILEANGIDCMLSGEAVRLTHGLTIDGLAEVRIRVREDDAAHARDVLAASKNPGDPGES
jgi:hypothetical protein